MKHRIMLKEGVPDKVASKKNGLPSHYSMDICNNSRLLNSNTFYMNKIVKIIGLFFIFFKNMPTTSNNVMDPLNFVWSVI